MLGPRDIEVTTSRGKCTLWIVFIGSAGTAATAASNMRVRTCNISSPWNERPSFGNSIRRVSGNRKSVSHRDCNEALQWPRPTLWLPGIALPESDISTVSSSWHRSLMMGHYDNLGFALQKKHSLSKMCCMIYDQCRFCETEKIAFMDLCSKGTTGNICVDHSFQLRPYYDLVDVTARCLRATIALRRSKRRHTCFACEDLTTQVICVVPASMATKDIDVRPAFTWRFHYYCPALLDAIYTAATYSLSELQQRLRNGTDLLRWEAIPEDYDASILNNLDGSRGYTPSDHKMLRRITTVDRHEHHNSLFGGGQMGRALLSQEQRERQSLGQLIALRQYLRDKLDAKQIKEYKVLCDPDCSPIEHVRIALAIASNGGKLCRGISLRKVARRVSEWERYFDVGLTCEKRRTCEPQGSSALLWVDRGYGKKHPHRIQEIARLEMRHHLEQ